jgi:excisionase family DNA binding protein
MTASQMAGEQNDAKGPENAVETPSESLAEQDAGARRGSGVIRKANAIPGDIMTRSEVALLLRCSEPHVVALIEREQLPAFRLGKLWRFRRSEVLAWCERRENGSRTA